jgi:hypothetical protein
VRVVFMTGVVCVWSVILQRCVTCPDLVVSDENKGKKR